MTDDRRKPIWPMANDSLSIVNFQALGAARRQPLASPSPLTETGIARQDSLSTANFQALRVVKAQAVAAPSAAAGVKSTATATATAPVRRVPASAPKR